MGQPRGAERRQKILRATLGVISGSGIAAVTHRTVAERADVPLGALTYYFASKEDLLREALLLFVAEEVERLRAIGAQLEGGALSREELAQRFGAVLESHDGEQVAQFELYLEAARDPALRDAARRCFAAYEEVARIALRAAGAPDPDRGAALFVALADGLGLRRLAGGDGPALHEALLELFAAIAAKDGAVA